MMGVVVVARLYANDEIVWYQIKQVRFVVRWWENVNCYDENLL